MNPLLGPPKKNKHVLELQLTAMIDVFSMIVIFLILGSVFGGADIVLPKGLSPPRSKSVSVSASAPTFSLLNGKVESSLIPGLTVSMDEVRSSGAGAAELKSKVSQFLSSTEGAAPRPSAQIVPNAETPSARAVNIAADELASYQDVFDLGRWLREAGFEELLFVAISEGR